MQNGLIFNVQRYSIHDGPGIRTTVFLKGCPLRCSWCHNPEGISPEPRVAYFQNRCLHCGECQKVCPQVNSGNCEKSEKPSADGAALTNPTANCTLCGACIEVCPVGARQLVGRKVTVDDVMAEILLDKVFYDESGGGVTFSGGEPLRQANFLRNLLVACRDKEIHTVVDTTGYAPIEDLQSIAPLTDLFLYDIKVMEDELHQKWTGVSNVPILKNLAALGQIHDNIWIRVPLVAGVNDDAKQLDAVARLAITIPGVRQVNLLPYHRIGDHKWISLGASRQLHMHHAPTDEMIENAMDTFQAYGLNIQIGG